MNLHKKAALTLSLLSISLPAAAWAEGDGDTDADKTSVPPVIKLSGCPATDYVASMRVGNQSFSMLVDSGSTTLAVAGGGCRSCRGLSPEYAPSSTAKNQQHSARSMYGDGSGWVGTIYSDVAEFVGVTGEVPVMMADISQQSSFFSGGSCTIGKGNRNFYQGILGLGPLDLAVRGTNSFMQDLHSSGGNPNNTFTVQLCDVGGNMWIGGYDPSFISGAPEYTPMDTTSPFYAVELADLQLGGSSIGYGPSDFGSAIVDTGTSALLLPQDIFNSTVGAIENDPTFQSELAGNGSGWFAEGACNPAASLSQAELDAQLPRMQFIFPDANGDWITVDAPATQSYLMPMSDGRGTMYYCAGVAEGMQTILGGAFLRSRVTVFDMGRSQIGFAPHDSCPAVPLK